MLVKRLKTDHQCFLEKPLQFIIQKLPTIIGYLRKWLKAQESISATKIDNNDQNCNANNLNVHHGIVLHSYNVNNLAVHH
jgi:hypothetical protein